MGRRPPERHTTYFNLRDALEAPGCAICTLVTKVIAKSLDDLLYERVNDPGVRQQLRQSHGFCHRHAWELCALGDGFGVGLLYQDLLEQALVHLRQTPARRHTPPASTPVCPSCRQAAETVARYLDVFIQSFDDSGLRHTLTQASSLCLPHFEEARSRCRTEAQRAALTAWEADKLSTLLTKLQEFIRKHDYRYMAEGYREGEGSSWLRAVEMFIGKASQPPDQRRS